MFESTPGRLFAGNLQHWVSVKKVLTARNGMSMNAQTMQTLASATTKSAGCRTLTEQARSAKVLPLQRPTPRPKTAKELRTRMKVTSAVMMTIPTGLTAMMLIQMASPRTLSGLLLTLAVRAPLEAYLLRAITSICRFLTSQSSWSGGF